MKNSKRSIIALFIAAFSFGAAIAQEAAISGSAAQGASGSPANGSGFYGGVRVMPQITWMLNKSDAGNSAYEALTHFSMCFGLAGGYSFDDHLGAEANVLYSMEGKRYRLSGTEYVQHTDYLKVPLLFVYTTRPATVMFIGKVGPQFNLLTHAKVEPAIVNGATISDNMDQYQNFVVAGALSLGVRYQVSDVLSLDASVRGDFSFTNVENQNYKYFAAGRAKSYTAADGLEIGANYYFK